MSQLDLAIIEWHDGVLARIDAEEHGTCFHFSRVLVYREVAANEYDIEKCRASLFLEGGTAKESVDSRAVSDCFLDASCESDDVKSLLTGVGAGTIRLVLTDGTSVETAFSAARLTLLEPFLPIEHWSGPLFREESS